jgi:hypothetical protein
MNKRETRDKGTLSGGEGLRVSGYAATWDTYDMGSFEERLDPAAFTRALEQADEIALLWNHDTGKPLARVRAGNLRLWADETGLGFEATLPDTQSGREAYELVKSGVVTQCSFGFQVRDETYEKGSVKPLRIIRDADLLEISLVTFPANEGTSVEARAEAQPAPVKRLRMFPPA